ncbi:hypothetical protein BH23BAC1_BH23BAC1_23750 [soil metagenome]
MNNLFPEGSVVFTKANPNIKLIVRRYISRIYYCTNPQKPLEKDAVYFERELMN